MCHQKDKEPQPKVKDVFVLDQYGEIVAGPVKVRGPIRGAETLSGLTKEVRVYGKPDYVPKGTSWVAFKYIVTRTGDRVNF